MNCCYCTNKFSVWVQLFERRGTVSGRSQLQELCGVMGGYGDEGHTVSQYHRPNRHNYRYYSHGFGGYLAYLFSSILVQTSRKLTKCTSYLTIGNQTRLICNVANMKRFIHEQFGQQNSFLRKTQYNFVPLICQN